MFNRSGEYLAIGGRDGEIRVWESDSGKLKQRFVPGQSGGEIKCLAWSRLTKEVSANEHRFDNRTQILHNISLRVGSWIV